MHDGPLNKGFFPMAVVPSRRVAKSFDGAASGGHGVQHLGWVQTMGHDPDTSAVGEAGGTDSVFTPIID